jgi:hypothetical protein
MESWSWENQGEHDRCSFVCSHHHTVITSHRVYIFEIMDLLGAIIEITRAVTMQHVASENELHLHLCEKRFRFRRRTATTMVFHNKVLIRTIMN